MPHLGLLTGTVERSYGGLPALPLINLIPEAAITEPTQFVLQARPKLQKHLSVQMGSAVPTRALYYTEDTNLGNYFAVFGTSFYENADSQSSTTLSGNIIPSIAGNEIGIVATAGGAAKWWDGTAFRSITFPDTANVTKVMESQGRFVFIRASSHRYYWTDPLANMLDGSGDIVINGADYVSAESEPDWLVDGIVWNGRLVLGGTQTIEIHAPSGNDNAPWQPLTGAVVQQGVVNTGAMALWGNGFAWVSPEGGIWAYDGVGGTKISPAGIDETMRLWNAAYIQLDRFLFNGKQFLHVWPVDSGTGAATDTPDIILDGSTGEWMEWETDGSFFDGGVSVRAGELYPIFASRSDTRILGMPEGSVSLAGGSWETAVEHRWRAGLPIDGGALPIHNVLLRCQTYGSGSQTVSMRYSRDKGNTWSNYVAVSLVNTSNIRNRIEWRALGVFDNPGALFEFKTANATASFSVSGAMFNEFVRGRSR